MGSVKLTVLPSFTQFYPTGFTHWVKLPCQPWFSAFETWLGDGFANETGNCARVYVELFVELLSSSLTLRLKVTYTYSTGSILKYFDGYIGNYDRGTFLNLATSLYYFIIKLGVSCRLSNGWLAVLCIRFAH